MLQLALTLALLVTHAIVDAQTVNANAIPEAVDVDATIDVKDEDRMEVTFNFSQAKNHAEYTVVNVGAQQDSRGSDTNPPFLLGKLSKGAIASSSAANHILVGVSGSGNSTSAIDISNVTAPIDKTGTRTFRIGFLRYTDLKNSSPDGLAVSLPGVTYGQVRHVTVNKPGWASEIRSEKAEYENVRNDFDAVTFSLKKDGGLVSFEVVPGVGPLQHISALILDNLIWFTGTLVIGAILSFLAPVQAHKVVRVFLGIMAAIGGAYLLRGILSGAPTGIFIENYAPALSAELGLLMCITFFERLDKLVQLFAK